MTSIQTYLDKVDAMLARPDLATKADKESFYLRLLSYWSGHLLNTRPKGGPPAVGFTPLQISDLMVELERRRKALAGASSAPLTTPTKDH